jgi:hypothetical protein
MTSFVFLTPPSPVSPKQSQVFRLRLAVTQRRLSFAEAFSFLTSPYEGESKARAGFLSPGRLWAALEFLGVPCDANTGRWWWWWWW